MLCVWREMYGRGHALMCAAPPLGQEWRFLKKLGTFFNLGTIFEIDSISLYFRCLLFARLIRLIALL